MKPMDRSHVAPAGFNRELRLPYELRVKDFDLAMQDVYDFFFDVNSNLLGRGLKRLDDLLRPAAMSGFISDMLTASLANHARSLTENRYHNGHPDLLVEGVYPDNSVAAGKKALRSRRPARRVAPSTFTEHGISGSVSSCTRRITTQSQLALEGRWSSPRSTSATSRSTTSVETSGVSWERGRQRSIETAFGSFGGVGSTCLATQTDSRRASQTPDTEDDPSIGTPHLARTRSFPPPWQQVDPNGSPATGGDILAHARLARSGAVQVPTSPPKAQKVPRRGRNGRGSGQGDSRGHLLNRY